MKHGASTCDFVFLKRYLEKYKIKIKMDIETSHQDWIASSDFQDTGGEIDGYVYISRKRAISPFFLTYQVTLPV